MSEQEIIDFLNQPLVAETTLEAVDWLIERQRILGLLRKAQEEAKGKTPEQLEKLSERLEQDIKYRF